MIDRPDPFGSVQRPDTEVDRIGFAVTLPSEGRATGGAEATFGNGGRPTKCRGSLCESHTGNRKRGPRADRCAGGLETHTTVTEIDVGRVASGDIADGTAQTAAFVRFLGLAHDSAHQTGV